MRNLKLYVVVSLSIATFSGIFAEEGSMHAGGLLQNQNSGHSPNINESGRLVNPKAEDEEGSPLDAENRETLGQQVSELYDFSTSTSGNSVVGPVGERTK